MRCIFVMDIFNGEVVHAVRGQRSLYRPINTFSKVVSTSDPLDIVEALSPAEVYIADLNRLSGAGDNISIIESVAMRSRTIADVGISTESELSMLPEIVTPVLGTETASLDLIRRASDIRDIFVSIDMKNRRIISQSIACEALDFIKAINDLELEGLILLELDRVGTASGIDREFLSRVASSTEHPLFVGGGVRGLEDLKALETVGVAGALVATAVHSGAIPTEMLRRR